MPTHRRMRFVHWQLAWMVAATVLLAVVGSLSLELFVVVSLVGLVVVAELTAPQNVTPRWRSRLRWVALLGVVAFVIVVIRRTLAILPPELVPL